MNTPVENYKLTFTPEIDEYNGVFRYVIVGSCSEHTIRGEFQLNKLEKCIEGKIYYNAGRLITTTTVHHLRNSVLSSY